MTETATLPCAVCRVYPKKAGLGSSLPYGANIFRTSGHEGATAYDAGFGGEHLEALICTGCLGLMQLGEAVHRVLHATENVPEQRVLWQSEEDPRGENPWNKQRLRNDFAMEDYFEATPGISQEWAKLIYDACQEASRDGKAFNPASVPAPEDVSGV